MRNKIRAFTLIELMLVVIIIGVLVGTDLYGLGISIYFSLELKRLGLSPVLNLISEKEIEREYEYRL